MRDLFHAESRRRFLGTLATGTAAALLPLRGLYGAATARGNNRAPFRMKYAPPLGMFEESAGKDPLDQIRFMADQVFRGMFDNGLMNRPVAEQEAIARETSRRGRSRRRAIGHRQRGDRRLKETGDRCRHAATASGTLS
jgi:hypothetical protein